MQSIFRLAARRRPAGIGKAFTAPVTERWIGRKRRPAVGLLWALHCGQTARVGICRAAAGRLATAGGQCQPAAMAANPDHAPRCPIQVEKQEPPYGKSAVFTGVLTTTEAPA